MTRLIGSPAGPGLGPDPDGAAASLREAVPAFVPSWDPAPTGPGAGLLTVAARFLAILEQAVEAAPGRTRLSFLDALGVPLRPARSARAPVVFTAQSGAPDSRAPAGTRVAAGGGADPAPVAFETQAAVAVAGARLTQLVSLWPARDEYADHSSGTDAATLFAGRSPVPHELYLGSERLLALNGTCTVEVELTFTVVAPERLAVTWEYWDGGAWRAFDAPDGSDPVDRPDRSFDGTAGFTRSGVVRLLATGAVGRPTTVAGRSSSWIRARLERPAPPDPVLEPPRLAGIRLRSVITTGGTDTRSSAGVRTAGLHPAGLHPDAASANGLPADPSATMLPFGVLPQPGNVFTFSSAATLSRPGATVAVAVQVASDPGGTPSDGATAQSTPWVVWEYWNGERWSALPGAIGAAAAFTGSGTFSVDLPADASPVSDGGRDVWSWRVRLVSGGYVRSRTVSYTGATSATGSLTTVEPTAPVVTSLSLSSVFTSGWTTPDGCVCHDDLTFTDHVERLGRQGDSVPVFTPVADLTPTVYLGFDRPLPSDLVGLYVGLDDDGEDQPGPALEWEYWNGSGWADAGVTDETANLRRPGIVSWIGPGDSVALARFGPALHWLRARRRQDGEPEPIALRGLHLNATWAAQQTTIRDELVGTAAGETNETFFLRRVPVLEGEVVEVRESSGGRAAIDLPTLRAEVIANGGQETDVRAVNDARTGLVTEVWVRWTIRENLLSSRPDDRHYLLERTQGRLLFGDGVYGRRLPVGAAVAARSYSSGGGRAGNVPAGSIDQLLGAVPFVTGVRQPAAAEGGADGESLAELAVRGPSHLRSRGQAVAAVDYETLAREASSAVAVTRALPGVGPQRRPASGWVAVVIVPRSTEPRPAPSQGLRQQVLDFLAARVPAAVRGRVVVLPPAYLPVGVSAALLPQQRDAAGPVLAAAAAALADFLHPLSGGPDGTGWPFGRYVHASDVAARLTAIPGVDSVTDLQLLRDEAPQGDVVAVPPDRLVVAGPIRLRVGS